MTKHKIRPDLPHLRPLGEWEIQGQGMVVFDSEPMAAPQTTVALEWGSVTMIVRVEVRAEGKARGKILETIWDKTVPAVNR